MYAFSCNSLGTVGANMMFFIEIIVFFSPELGRRNARCLPPLMRHVSEAQGKAARDWIADLRGHALSRQMRG